ncbi:MAG: hypothetical protein QW836_10350 [Ignisphaera sp.]
MPTHIQLAGLNIAVVVAKQVTFMKEGPPTILSEILANPKGFHISTSFVQHTTKLIKFTELAEPSH